MSGLGDTNHCVECLRWVVSASSFHLDERQLAVFMYRSQLCIGHANGETFALGVARLLARSVNKLLYIILASGSSDGSTSGDHHGQCSIIPSTPYRLARHR